MAAKTSRRSYVRYHWTLAQRLDHHTDKSGGPNACWPWLSAIKAGGYGHMKAKHRYHSAHRAAWEVVNGPVPDGWFVCHRCDNKRCVNPSHLFVGPPAANSADMVAKGRARGIRRLGMASPAAKLTDDQVRAIRRLHGTITQREIAKRFGVHINTVERILALKSWVHI